MYNSGDDFSLAQSLRIKGEGDSKFSPFPLIVHLLKRGPPQNFIRPPPLIVPL